MTPDVLKRYREFRAMGVGGLVGHDASRCLDLARAEVFGEELGLTVQWEWDDNPDVSWMSEREVERYRKGSIEVLYGYVQDCEGQTLSGLGGVTVDHFKGKQTRDYLRLCGAELLQEAISELKRGVA